MGQSINYFILFSIYRLNNKLSPRFTIYCNAVKNIRAIHFQQDFPVERIIVYLTFKHLAETSSPANCCKESKETSNLFVTIVAPSVGALVFILAVLVAGLLLYKKFKR